MNDITSDTGGLVPDVVSPARRAWIAVSLSVLMAMEVATARRDEPGTFPLVPQGTDAIVDFMTRKALADLLNLGFRPDGWQTEFFRDGAS